MANLHAAMGLAQLKKIERISESRRAACRYYNEHLSKLAEVIVPRTDFTDITPFLYYIRVPAAERDALRAYMKEHGVDTGIHWQPGHWFTLFKDCRRIDLSVSDRVGNEILSLPLHSMMATETLDRVIDSIRSFFSQ
jgi:dTDP-4-amino-4,6-dideoxygalactose transaminase